MVGLANRRGFELSRRIAHLPSAVVGLGALEFVLRRRVADFIALVAEIEFQVFAGVGFLLAVAEGAIERIAGFQFAPLFLVSSEFRAQADLLAAAPRYARV